jgi:hypothetical protein
MILPPNLKDVGFSNNEDKTHILALIHHHNQKITMLIAGVMFLLMKNKVISKFSYIPN